MISAVDDFLAQILKCTNEGYGRKAYVLKIREQNQKKEWGCKSSNIQLCFHLYAQGVK